MPLVAATLLLLAVRGVAEPEQWLGVFPKLPTARRLCDQHVLGQSDGKRVEISFTLYASSRAPAEAVRFYAKFHNLPWRPGQQTIIVTLANGHKTLAVHPAAAVHPECGVTPASAERTIIVVSEKVP